VAGLPTVPNKRALCEAVGKPQLSQICRNPMYSLRSKKEQDKARGCKLPLAVTADGSAARILQRNQGFSDTVSDISPT